MAENGESRSKSIKQKYCKDARSKSSQPVVWSEIEKLQLAEAIDMYGINFPTRLATHVPTKNLKQLKQKLAQLRAENRKEIEEMKKCPSFIDLNEMDDLFLISGTKPEDVMIKWMDYLQENYNKDPNSFNTFKLLSSSFLILSECTPPPKTTGPDVIDFRNVYYFLYRVFNNYYIGKQHGDTRMKNYLHQMFLRVMEEIKLTSDEEKITMYKIVSNWTIANKSNSLRVYGKKNEIKTEQTQQSVNSGIKPSLKIAPEFKVLETPMIPSFNPFQIKFKKFL